MDFKAVIFDLDGVVVSTDELHFQAWNKLAVREGIRFSRKINKRLRGVSRMESLAIILESAGQAYSSSEQEEMAAYKNECYRELLETLSPADLLPGALDLIHWLKQCGVRVAIGSSSKNARPILARIGLADSFDAVADGTDITHSKPDPEVFLCAAKKLGVEPATCMVVEDAVSGVEAAKAADMKTLGVGAAEGYEKNDYSCSGLDTIDRSLLVESRHAGTQG
jgi:beta-phosphoglucomutase